MEPIRFNAVVGPDQVIRPPGGVALPQGEIEVVVRPLRDATGPDAASLANTRSRLLGLARDAEQAAPDLPSDMAEHHDHYAHGKPLP
jgi:hypothetical protein